MGSSNFDSFSPVATFTVTSLPGGRQRTEYEARQEDGTGSLVITTLEYRPDGVYLVALQSESRAVAGVIVLNFAPADPVLVVLYPLAQHRASSFDLVSTDGCYRSHTDLSIEDTNVVLPIGESSYRTSRLKRTTSVKSDPGDSNCPRVDLLETRNVWYDVNTALSVREQVHLEGTVATFRIISDSTDTIRSTNPS